MKFDVFWESTERGVFRMEADSKDAASDELFLKQLGYEDLVGTGVKHHFDYDIKDADLSIPDDSIGTKPSLKDLDGDMPEDPGLITYKKTGSPAFTMMKLDEFHVHAK